MQKCMITELEDGGYVGQTIYEIKQIPDITILISEEDIEQEYAEKHKKEFETLLTEIYYNCKQCFNYNYTNQDYAIEFAFVTEPAVNQIYKANIKTYIIIRAIGDSVEFTTERINEISDIICNSLRYNKYEIEEVENKEECANKIIELASKNKRVITKDFKLDNLQSNYLPECFSFDVIPKKSGNFSRILNTLTNYPDSLILFDLIPTILTPYEIDNVEKMSNALDMLNKGIMSAEGNISNIIAEKHAETYTYYENNKNGILYAYNILVCSDYNALSNLTAKVISEIGMGDNQTHANLTYTDIYNEDIDIKTYFSSLPWALNEITYDFIMGQNPLANQPYARLPFVITAEEASEFFRIPFGDKMFAAGIKIIKANKNEKQYNKEIINTGDIMVGTLKSSSNFDKIGFNLNDLTKHMLIVGTPGSGKTTFSVGLLDQLWKNYKIPFLVIEPAKNEYRAMVDSIPDIQVFTPGKDFISPYILNSFKNSIFSLCINDNTIR